MIAHEVVVRTEHANICKVWYMASTQEKTAVITVIMPYGTCFQQRVRQEPSLLLQG